MNPTVLAHPPAPRQPDRDVENYYRSTRASTTPHAGASCFGRDTVLDLAAAVQPAPARILEIGCGTGRNLVQLARRFPLAQITGVDLSAPMLAIAGRKTSAFGPRVNLVPRAYDSPVCAHGGHDLVLCSYALTMFNPGFDAAIAAVRRDLAPGGHFALVDFHGTRLRWFARWMRVNHVRMDGQLRPLLRAGFDAVHDELRPLTAARGNTFCSLAGENSKMARANDLLDYALWPALMLAAGFGMAWGMAHGRGQLVFNLVYLGLAAALFILENSGRTSRNG